MSTRTLGADVSSRPAPETVLRHYWGIGGTYVLVAAVELDIFSRVAAGLNTVASLAQAIPASTRGLRLLLDAMAGLQLLEKRGLEYRLTAESEEYLLPTSPRYFGLMIRQGGQFASRLWSSLPDLVRRGSLPPAPSTTPFNDAMSDMVAALFPLSYMRAQAFYQALSDLELGEIRTVLDIGAGSGAWTLPLAEMRPTVRVTALDVAPVLEVTRRYASEMGVLGQYEFLPGDADVDEFRPDEYDLVVACNLCHCIGERRTRAMLAKCYQAAKRGGRLMIADFIPNDERTGPLIPLLAGVTMLLTTPEGDVFTFEQYDRWLREIGFSSVTARRVDHESPIIVALK